MEKIIALLCPPILLSGLVRAKSIVFNMLRIQKKKGNRIGHDQGLEVYWNEDMARLLETWGEGNVWSEILFLLVNCNGKVLDIGCGTGKTLELLSKFDSLDVFGCDISDFLIGKAIERGIQKNHLTVCDATNTPYPDNHFSYTYSIGSLEHFTEDGIVKFISECYRITQKTSFHMIPVSKSGKDEGWIKMMQTYYNNSPEWWLAKYKTVYQKVYILDSNWKDDISVGKWFICVK